jgi:aromatic-amino-acid transaminase
MFQHVDIYPGDPILTLNEDFAKDPRSGKVNLSIGVYLDESGKLPIMAAVRKAEAAVFAGIGSRPYLPMEGAADYRRQAQLFIFGKDAAALADNRIATVQTIGGSGALKVGADFLHSYFSTAKVWVSAPTWDNHFAIFSGAGYEVRTYPYYSPATKGVDFAAMAAALERVPAGDIVVLHASCHNPTGADLTPEQWRQLADIVRRRALIPFFDIAYQGFGEGAEEDAYAIRFFVQEGISCFVASSFSKNFSLYGERCGSLHVVCPEAAQAENVLGQLKAAVRRNYSSPPTHGARIVATVLSDETLRAAWHDELCRMRERIFAMRRTLHDTLATLRPDQDFAYLLRQKGMFSFTGLSAGQVRQLREESGVYLIGSGRMCVAALTEKTIEPAATAIARVV